MENFEILLIVLVSLTVGAAIYDGFLQLTGRLATKPPKVNWRKNWAGALETLGPVKVQPLDNWVRDGSEPPPKPDSFSTMDVIVVQGKHKGVGSYDHITGRWQCCLFSDRGSVLVSEVDAWQKFPDYEKI